MFAPANPAKIEAEHFDLVVIGTGFGSSFFLHKMLRKRPKMRVLVLEWGRFNDHAWRIENNKNSNIGDTETFTTGTSWKPWWSTIGFGGGSNCWQAVAPRFHPSDFKLQTLYGVGSDWPFDYEDLEPFYTEAEQLMHIAGDDAISAVMPRSRPFPQKPHRMSTPDSIMKAAMPDLHFGTPSARVLEQRGKRGACCASMRCQLCPVDSKFTIENGLPTLYTNPNITLLLDARVLRFELKGGEIEGVVFSSQDLQGQEFKATGDLFVLGANAIQAPFVALKSGIEGPLIGRGLHEKFGFSAEVLLRGMKNFDGGTVSTGVNYALNDGPWRRESGAALVLFQNHWLHGVRLNRGRWQEILPLSVQIEDLPNDQNGVSADGDLPDVTFNAFSDYAQKAADRVMNALPKLLAPLPVEDIKFRAIHKTHGHMQGTMRMGKTPADSVVDAGQVHHRHRNLVVVGSSVLPTCSSANPSLTVAATSLRAAQTLL